MLTLNRPRYTFMSAIHRSQLLSAICALVCKLRLTLGNPVFCTRWQGVFVAPDEVDSAKRSVRRSIVFYLLQASLPVPA